MLERDEEARKQTIRGLSDVTNYETKAALVQRDICVSVAGHARTERARATLGVRDRALLYYWLISQM